MNWYELRLLDNAEKVTPKPVWKAFVALCTAYGYKTGWLDYERRRGTLKALGELWERSATEEELDKLHRDAAACWDTPDEQYLRAQAEEEEKERKKEEARLQAWHERIMAQKEAEWARERAEAEKKGRRKK